MRVIAPYIRVRLVFPTKSIQSINNSSHFMLRTRYTLDCNNVRWGFLCMLETVKSQHFFFFNTIWPAYFFLRFTGNFLWYTLHCFNYSWFNNLCFVLNVTGIILRIIWKSKRFTQFPLISEIAKIHRKITTYLRGI